MTSEIPQPPPLPIIGNLREIDPGNGIQSLGVLAEKYGEIYKLNMLGRETIIISSQALASEACDDKRFNKAVGVALGQVRNGVGSGLFTAYHGEHDWEVGLLIRRTRLRTVCSNIS